MGVVARVLGGALPEEEHAAMFAQFWELFPQFEHMRGVVERVVAERRATASMLDIKVLEIRDRFNVEREAVWDDLFATLLDGYDGSQEAKDRCNRRLERTKAWSKEIIDAEMVEIRAAYREDTDDFARCYRFLVWHHERETLKSMRPKVHCV